MRYYMHSTLCLILLLLATTSGFCLNIPLHEALSSVLTDTAEFQIQSSEVQDCQLSTIPRTVEEVQYLAYRDCQLKMHLDTSSTMLKYRVYRKSGVFDNVITKTYTKAGGDLYSFFQHYFPDWELRGEAVANVNLASEWKCASIPKLQQLLAQKYATHVDTSKKRFYVSAKSSQVATSELNFAIFYKFPELNQDFYELVKSYANQVKLIRYRRNNELYLQIAEPASSREELTKTYTFLKALLDDRVTKAQKLGTYFMKNERLNLQLIYVLLSDAEILAFHNGEIEELPTSMLSSLGLESEKSKITKRLSNEFRTVLELPSSLAQKSKALAKPTKRNSRSLTSSSKPAPETSDATASTPKTKSKAKKVPKKKVVTATIDGRKMSIPKMRN